MVKIPEAPHTRRQSRNSASGCIAVTKMVRGRLAGSSFLPRGLTRPPASRRDLHDPVIRAERGKPVLSRRFTRSEGRKADRKGSRWEAGSGARSKRTPGCNDRDSR